MQPLTNVHYGPLEVPLLGLVVEPGDMVMVSDDEADGFRPSPHYWHVGGSAAGNAATGIAEASAAGPVAS